MSFSLTNNFFLNARAVTFEDSASVTIAVYKLVKLVTVKNEHTIKTEHVS